MAGAPFDMAWDRAWDRVEWPHETPNRRAWKQGLAWSRDAWRAAYEETGAATDALSTPLVLA